MPTTSINIIPQNGNSSVVAINCGTSSPKLGGTIDVSAFPNLQEFRCISNNITSFTGLENTPNITALNLDSNLLTGPVPSFSANPLFRILWAPNNRFTSIPNPSDYVQLRTISLSDNSLLTDNLPPLSTNAVDVYFHNSRFTGPIPTLSGCTNISTYYAHSQLGTTKLTGSIPQLPVSIVNFLVHTNQLTGSIPSLNGLTLLRDFRCQSNQLTGSIPSLSGLTNLRQFFCSTNQLTGSIPSLNGLTLLQEFICHTNQLTGFGGSSVSNTLGRFEAQNNQLTSSAVNAILAAFVAANKTTEARILNLGGTGNAAPTGQGLTDKATLISRGWTVTTN